MSNGAYAYAAFVGGGNNVMFGDNNHVLVPGGGGADYALGAGDSNSGAVFTGAPDSADYVGPSGVDNLQTFVGDPLYGILSYNGTW